MEIVKYFLGFFLGVFIWFSFTAILAVRKIKRLNEERNTILREILKETKLNQSRFYDSQAVLSLLLGSIKNSEKKGKKS